MNRTCSCGAPKKQDELQCRRCTLERVDQATQFSTDWDKELENIKSIPSRKPTRASLREVKAEARRRRSRTAASQNNYKKVQRSTSANTRNSLSITRKLALRFAKHFSILDGFVTLRGPLWTDVEYHTETKSNTVGGVYHVNNSNFDFFGANTNSRSVTRASYRNYISKLIIGNTSFYDFPVPSRQYLEALEEGSYIKAILLGDTDVVLLLNSTSSSIKFGHGFSTGGYTFMQVLGVLGSLFCLLNVYSAVIGIPLGIFSYLVATESKKISQSRWTQAIDQIS